MGCLVGLDSLKNWARGLIVDKSKRLPKVSHLLTLKFELNKI